MSKILPFGKSFYTKSGRGRDGGGSDGGDGVELTERIAALEHDSSSIKTDIAVIKSNYSTKSDLATMETHLIKWMVGTVLAAAALAVGFTRAFPPQPPQITVQMAQPTGAVQPSVAAPPPASTVITPRK